MVRSKPKIASKKAPRRFAWKIPPVQKIRESRPLQNGQISHAAFSLFTQFEDLFTLDKNRDFAWKSSWFSKVFNSFSLGKVSHVRRKTPPKIRVFFHHRNSPFSEVMILAFVCFVLFFLDSTTVNQNHHERPSFREYLLRCFCNHRRVSQL